MERYFAMVPSDVIVGFGLFTIFCFICFFAMVLLSVVTTIFSVINYKALKRIEKRLNASKEEA